MKLIQLIYLLLTLFYYSSQICYQPILRKEIRELTEEEFLRFVNAIRALQKIKINNSPYTKYDLFSKLHFESELIAHGNPKFFPWHRLFIKLFELELQKVDSRIALPYWDWSLDYLEPSQSIVLSDAYFGGQSQERSYCLTSSKIGNMTLNYPSQHCLQRQFTESKIPPFASPFILNSILNFKQFSKFAFNLEEKHGDPHYYIGGQFDFSSMYSPNDPLFYLHHAFIDKLWYEWQLRNSNPLQYDGEYYDLNNVNLNDSLTTWNVKVKDVLDTKSNYFCYYYKRYQPDLFNNKQFNNFEISPKSLNNNYQPVKKTNSIFNNIDLMDIDEAIYSLKRKIPNSIHLNSNNNPVLIKGRKSLPNKWILKNHLNLTKVRLNEKRENLLLSLVELVYNNDNF